MLPTRPLARDRYNEFNHHRKEPGTEGRPFAYFVMTGGRFLYASAIRMVVLKALVSLSVRQVALFGCSTRGGRSNLQQA